MYVFTGIWFLTLLFFFCKTKYVEDDSDCEDTMLPVQEDDKSEHPHRE